MRFTKMQGVGNDFVVLDGTGQNPDTDWALVAQRLCERRFGIGADGLLVLTRSASSIDFAFRMFNPDGSEDMCGNGLRCAGLWAFCADWIQNASEFQVDTKDGPRSVRLLSLNENCHSAMLGVDMGIPQLQPSAIPFLGSSQGPVVSVPLVVEDRSFLITTVYTGSTHTVIFGNPPAEEVFQTYSPKIEHHPLFPERTSVLWATSEGEHHFRVRIWERGAGETLGCGTGACAVGVAAILNNLSKPGVPIAVASKGGTLQITWSGPESSIDMVGPAQNVYTGEIDSEIP